MNPANIPVVRLNSPGTKAFQSFCLSFNENHISDAPPGIQPGELVRIVTESQTIAGIGYFNPLSRIPLRILSSEDVPPDRDFWTRSIQSAHAFRYPFYSREESYRVVYGESDFLPGLIVDKFGSCLSVQITTAGIERFQDILLDVLQDIFDPSAILLAFDSLPRKKEGLSLYRKIGRGTIPGVHYAVIDGTEHAIDVINGHKTGFFLDQRLNRQKAALLCSGKTVLDMFCYSGAFGVRAALQDAEHVTCVDIFDPALETGKLTARHNGLENGIDFVKSEAFGFLNRNRGNTGWDVIFLDPPSFVRGRHRAQRNLVNYRKVALLAIENLNPEGLLVTSCCSFHVTRNDFMNITATAFSQAGRKCRIFHIGSLGPDHPVHPSIEGTDYLKCFFVRADA